MRLSNKFACETRSAGGRYNGNCREDVRPLGSRSLLSLGINRLGPCHLTVRILPSQGRYTGSIPVRATIQSLVERNPAGFHQKYARFARIARSCVQNQERRIRATERVQGIFVSNSPQGRGSCEFANRLGRSFGDEIPNDRRMRVDFPNRTRVNDYKGLLTAHVILRVSSAV